MSFCTITPTRNDRPQLLEFCKHQLSRMTVKPDKSYFIDYPALNGAPDLVARIQLGITRAKVDGFQKVYIIEDDDYMRPDYFEQLTFSNGTKIIGSKSTLCYNLKYNSWALESHDGRSSLHHTAFDISALDQFRWPGEDYLFLDRKLWIYVNRQHIPHELISNPLIVSMKHGIGKVGGRGHRMNYPNKDPDRSYLKSIVDSEAFIFYQSLKV